ncbi:MAG: 1-pyrroline-5-carboxylate dehydrogenase [Elusimicrobia bacterium]|nr:MAG: 1-pyrroline-5-carboxylate dehydrogenase [Elusimicrobiota bacterium]
MTATTAPEDMKITYTSNTADMETFHKYFDEALEAIMADMGKDYPMVIGGKSFESELEPIANVSPVDHDLALGSFSAADERHVDMAVSTAKGAFPAWRDTPWQKRVEILRKAAHLIRKRKFEFAALMSLEVGKSRMESIGDAEESADLIDYYCKQMEDANGFVTLMDKITPIETNTDVLRPFGVFACIAPFNFPLALPCGMSSAALVAGNTIVFKPAEDCPWTGYKLTQLYHEAGVPVGAFNFLPGFGDHMGDWLTSHANVDGVVFTGSKQVGLHIYNSLSKKWVKPCLMEMGGKNAAIVMESADLDAAADGIVRSAWGLQNQKCSACSRVYVHKSVAEELTKKILERTEAIVKGDPSEKDVFFGPVINEQAFKKWEAAVALGRKDGELLVGGKRLTGGIFDKGFYLEPTIVQAPLESRIFFEEFFSPFLAIGEVDSLDEAIRESNKAEYGLTAGIFSKEKEELDKFFNEMQTGVLYANKRSGATTGAWPGAQPFCGWKGSGATGKGGCGPYYTAQFMREQTRCVVEE